MFLAAVSLGFFISMLLSYQPRRVESVDWTPQRRHHCTDVITKMVQGHWERNNVTEKEKLDMYEFYDQVMCSVSLSPPPALPTPIGFFLFFFFGPVRSCL